MKRLIVVIVLLLITTNSYAQRTIKTKFYITSKVAEQNNGSGYNYHFVSGYDFDIDLYVYITNGFDANPIIRNGNNLPIYLSSPNDKLILSSKINKYNQIDVFLPKYGTYKMIAINKSFGRKMVANIGGPCIDCGVTNVTIQLNEEIHRRNLNLANYDYDSTLVYIYDDNTKILDFKSGHFSLPYNTLLTDVYSYKRERLIYSFNIPRNSFYKFYLPEGKFHFVIFDPVSSNKGTLNVDIPYNSPNYDEYKIKLSQKMPLKWVPPTTNSGLQIGEPRSQSSNTRVSKEEFEKVNGKTSMTILTEEEVLIEDQYRMIDLNQTKNHIIYYSKEMSIKTFDIVVPKNSKISYENIFVTYWDGISDTEYSSKLKIGSNLIKGYSIKIMCKDNSCFGKLYFKEK